MGVIWNGQEAKIIHDISSTMSPAKAYALPEFHALTGCDNTSFSVTGKKSACGSQG